MQSNTSCPFITGILKRCVQSLVFTAKLEGQAATKMQVPFFSSSSLRFACGDGEGLSRKLQIAPQLGYGTAHAM